MKNKKILILVVSVLLIIMLIPIPLHLKDGGSIEYKSLLYSVTKVHRLNPESITGYEEGLEIKILGMQIYNNVKFDVNVDTGDK